MNVNWPSDWPGAIVRGTIVLHDGRPARGARIVFKPSHAIPIGASSRVVIPVSVETQADDYGFFETKLAATDAIPGRAFLYTATITVDRYTEPWTCVFHAPKGAVLELQELIYGTEAFPAGGRPTPGPTPPPPPPPPPPPVDPGPGPTEPPPPPPPPVDPGPGPTEPPPPPPPPVDPGPGPVDPPSEPAFRVLQSVTDPTAPADPGTFALNTVTGALFLYGEHEAFTHGVGAPATPGETGHLYLDTATGDLYRYEN